jgi:hypothetical protein
MAIKSFVWTINWPLKEVGINVKNFKTKTASHLTTVLGSSTQNITGRRHTYFH